MKNMTFVGTLHNMLPALEAEFGLFLKTQNPEALFVEVTEEDLSNETLESSPNEMRFAVEWAKARNKRVVGFDCALSVLSSSWTKEKEKEISSAQLKLLGNASWRDANRAEFDGLGELVGPIVDVSKWNERERFMSQRIRAESRFEEQTLVLTGVSHLKHFETEFPDSQFIFR